MTRIVFTLLITLAASLLVIAKPGANILIYSNTTGYRHESIPFANAALQEGGPSRGLFFDVSEDPSVFTTQSLAAYDALIFMMTTDDPKEPFLDKHQQDAFQEYIDNGGNFVGVHSASYCLHNSKFYERTIGAYFNWHPELTNVTYLNNLEPNHPTVSMIPPEWTYPEEMYTFKNDPRKYGAKVVLSVKEETDWYADVHGKPHPIAWYQERVAGASEKAEIVGRSYYTSLGHLNATWQDPTFLGHIFASIKWVLEGKTTLAFNPNAKVGNAAGYAIAVASSPAPVSSSPSPTSTSTRSSSARPTYSQAPITMVIFGIFAAALGLLVQYPGL